MNRIRKVAVTLLCLTGMYPTQLRAKKLTVVGEDWPPFEFIKNGNPTGIDVDIIKYIFNKMGVK